MGLYVARRLMDDESSKDHESGSHEEPGRKRSRMFAHQPDRHQDGRKSNRERFYPCSIQGNEAQTDNH